MKKLSKGTVLAAAFAVVALVSTVFALNPSVFSDLKATNFQVTTVYDNTGPTARYTPGATNVFTGNVSVSGGQIHHGTSGTVLSTATTSGNSSGDKVTCYLGGTVNALEGSLLVAATPVAGQGCTVTVGAATSGLTTWVGVAKSAVSTGSAVDVYYSGFVLALTTGTVSTGDVLASTITAAGYLTASNTPTSGTDVAVAMSGGTSAGGRTLVRLH